MIKIGLLLGASCMLASAWFMPTFSYGNGASDESTTHIDKDFVRDDAKEIVINNKTSKIYYDGAPSSKMHFYGAWDYCQKMNFAGYDDWRVITKDEGRDLLELSRRSVTVKHAFKNVQKERYWSATQDRFEEAWYVDFDLGRYSTQKRKDKLYVLCVRDNKK